MSLEYGHRKRSEIAIAAKRTQPIWQWLYFALVAFDLVAISASLFLNHQLTVEYRKAVEINEFWSAQQGDFAATG